MEKRGAGFGCMGSCPEGGGLDMGGGGPGRELGGVAGGSCDVGGVGRGRGGWEGVGRIGPMRSFSLSGL